jgi:glycosyltransferase involved in cell wall biosynthesis
MPGLFYGSARARASDGAGRAVRTPPAPRAIRRRIEIAALIPAYQAEDSIGAVVRGVLPHRSPITVVDDGSTDRTAEAAAAAGADVLRHPENLGKGAALLTGFRHLAERGFTHALTLDADGQHLPDEVPKLVDAARREPHALVVGARDKAGHEIRGINLLGNWVADRLMTLIAGTPLPDTQSGFRIYPLASTLALGAQGSRFDFETEILLRAARAGMPLAGVVVRVHYPPVAERVTHYRPMVDTVRIVQTIARVVLTRA